MSPPTTHGFPPTGEHAHEPHSDSMGGLLNRLRAAVLGANDGIVSVAAIVMGFAGATADRQLILLGGVAALVGGALSMASGEYVSVSSQRDTERALIHKETRELANEPEEELAELAELYRARGLSDHLARQVALELTKKDALRAHLDVELGIDPDELTSPWQAAVASMVAFTIGGLLPLVTILVFPHSLRAVVTIAAVTAALGLTGYLSARVGDAPVLAAVIRNVIGGLLAMGVTYGIGSLIGVGVG